MAKRIQEPVKVRCCDCANENPVTNEFPAYDGTWVFCTCEYIKHYRQRRWPRPCQHYKPKEK